MLENWNRAIITDIILAARVSAKSGTAVHNDRSFHGFAINDSAANKKVYFSDGTVLNWGPNELCYLPKHASYRVDIFTPGDCWAMNFDLLEELQEKPFKIRFHANLAVLDMFVEAARIWKERPAHYSITSKKYLYAVIEQILKVSQHNYSASDKEKMLQPAMEAIKTGFTRNDLSIRELAALCHISETYFRRLFTNIYSLSPKDYMIQRRMEYAKDLLSCENFSVGEVAELCGYSEPCHFSREFHKHVGCSPKAYIHRTAR